MLAILGFIAHTNEMQIEQSGDILCQNFIISNINKTSMSVNDAYIVCYVDSISTQNMINNQQKYIRLVHIL